MPVTEVRGAGQFVELKRPWPLPAGQGRGIPETPISARFRPDLPIIQSCLAGFRSSIKPSAMHMPFSPIFACSFLLLFAAANGRALDDERPAGDNSKAPSEKAAVAGLPSLYLVGASTLKSDAPNRGWAQEIGAFFDPTRINAVNRAIGGRSSRSFQREGRWDKVLADLKPGDVVIVQFGHNDWGALGIGAEGKFRRPLQGLGEETQEVTLSDGVKETVHTFGWCLRKYGHDAKVKGASVVFCSMAPHKDWKEGKIKRGERDTLVRWTAESAKVSGAAFIDLNEIVALEFERSSDQSRSKRFLRISARTARP
jgi:rhamnogalacturonan acetylesterase